MLHVIIFQRKEVFHEYYSVRHRWATVPAANASNLADPLVILYEVILGNCRPIQGIVGPYNIAAVRPFLYKVVFIDMQYLRCINICPITLKFDTRGRGVIKN